MGRQFGANPRSDWELVIIETGEKQHRAINIDNRFARCCPESRMSFSEIIRHIQSNVAGAESEPPYE